MRKALIVVDMQKGLFGYLKDAETLLHNINQLIFNYREENYPIIFIQHENEDMIRGATEWKLLENLDVKDGDNLVFKTQPNSFYNTNLQYILNQLEIDTLEICGAQTEYCVDSTIKAAFYKGYKVITTPGTYGTADTEILSAVQINEFYGNMFYWLSEESPINPIKEII